MQSLTSLGPKFLNSDRGLEMGPVTSVNEGQDLVAQAPFGNARDLEWQWRFANRKGLSTACNSSSAGKGSQFESFSTFRGCGIGRPSAPSGIRMS